MPEENDASNFAWFLIGLAFGAVGAVLLAPHSGDETRDELRRRALENRERFAERGREAFARGRDLYERGKQMADEAAEYFEQARRRQAARERTDSEEATG